MYIYRHDESHALAVWAVERMTNEEWDLHFEHVRSLLKWYSKTGKRPGCMIIIGPNFERPDAKRRTTLAQLTDAPGFNSFVALIQPNTALRAILTTFRWLHKTPKHEYVAFATSAEGTKWLEARRGEPLPQHRQMLAEVEHDVYAAIGRSLSA
jgi:hypothetical protein